ncbi:MAG: hypothetical protein H8E53_11270, partial [Planctomycetes bacterium]|nr:hypothetical protein [Planctomycetota bacterium]
MAASGRTSFLPIAAMAVFVVMALARGASAKSPGEAKWEKAPKGSVVEKHGRLRVEGNRIVDKNGKPVAMHGMSLFWSQWMGQYY